MGWSLHKLPDASCVVRQLIWLTNDSALPLSNLAFPEWDHIAAKKAQISFFLSFLVCKSIQLCQNYRYTSCPGREVQGCFKVVIGVQHLLLEARQGCSSEEYILWQTWVADRHDQERENMLVPSLYGWSSKAQGILSSLKSFFSAAFLSWDLDLTVNASTTLTEGKLASIDASYSTQIGTYKKMWIGFYPADDWSFSYGKLLLVTTWQQMWGAQWKYLPSLKHSYFKLAKYFFFKPPTTELSHQTTITKLIRPFNRDSKCSPK